MSEKCIVCSSEEIYYTYHYPPFPDFCVCRECYEKMYAGVSSDWETIRKFNEELSKIPPKRVSEFRRGDILYRDALLKLKADGLPAFGTFAPRYDIIEFKQEYLILPKGEETPTASLESIDRIVPQRVKIPDDLKEGEIIIVNAVQLKRNVPATIVYYKDGKFYETGLRWWGWLGFRGTPEFEDEDYYYIPVKDW